SEAAPSRTAPRNRSPGPRERGTAGDRSSSGISDNQFYLQEKKDESAVQDPGDGQPSCEVAPVWGGIGRRAPDRGHDPHRVGGGNEDEDLLECQLFQFKRRGVERRKYKARRNPISPEDRRQRSLPAQDAPFRREEQAQCPIA